MAFVGGVSFGTKTFAGAKISQRVAVKSAPVKMAAEGMSASVPFLLKPKNTVGLPGSVEFDPLGFSDVINIRFLQEAEIKHGRICMLATVGFLVQEIGTFGGSYFPKMPPVEAHEFFMKTGGMSQLLLFISAFEAVSCYALKQTVDGERAPGDFGFDPLGLGKNPEMFKKYQKNEIKNGRLAMIGIGGFIHQYWVTHQTVLEQLKNFTILQDPAATNHGLENLLKLKGTLDPL